MSDKRAASTLKLRESLFELYEQGGVELYLAGTHGLGRELGHMITTVAVMRADENDGL